MEKGKESQITETVEKVDVKSLNIFQRMMYATSEINRVAKNLKVDVTKTASYKAVSEADILEAVKPIEEKWRIYSYPYNRKVIESDQLMGKDSYGNDRVTFFMRLEVVYRFVNIDKPDDYIDITSFGDGIDNGDKGPGKAMTYSDKYGLMKGYKIQTGEDPDKEASGEYKKPDPKQETKPDPKKAAATNTEKKPDQIPDQKTESNPKHVDGQVELVDDETLALLVGALTNDEIEKTKSYYNIQKLADLPKVIAVKMLNKKIGGTNT